jgi:hypothetical protein
MTAKARPLSDLLIALAGPIVWAAHFFFIYSMEAIICTRAAAPSHAMRWIGIAATVTAIGLLAVLLIRHYRIQQRRGDSAGVFLRDVSVWLTIISIGVVAGVALSAMRLPVCAPPAG